LMAKLTPEEVLRSLEEFPDDASMDEDIEAILAMTPEQIQSELEAAGYTREELDAEADKVLGPLRKARASAMAVAGPSAAPAAETSAPHAAESSAAPAAESAKVVSIVSRRRVSRWVYLLPVAAAFALVAMEGRALVAWVTGASDVHKGHATDPADVAREYRSEAAQAIAAKQWSSALYLLDEARASDPAGDATEEVRGMRRVAHEGLDGGGGP
jgi:hypothetical protein